MVVNIRSVPVVKYESLVTIDLKVFGLIRGVTTSPELRLLL